MIRLQTWHDLPHYVAAQYGKRLTAEEAETLLWGFTAYPAGDFAYNAGLLHKGFRQGFREDADYAD